MYLKDESDLNQSQSKFDQRRPYLLRLRPYDTWIVSWKSIHTSWHSTDSTSNTPMRRMEFHEWSSKLHLHHQQPQSIFHSDWEYPWHESHDIPPSANWTGFLTPESTAIVKHQRQTTLSCVIRRILSQGAPQHSWEESLWNSSPLEAQSCHRESQRALAVNFQTLNWTTVTNHQVAMYETYLLLQKMTLNWKNSNAKETMIRNHRPMDNYCHSEWQFLGAWDLKTRSTVLVKTAIFNNGNTHQCGIPE